MFAGILSKRFARNVPFGRYGPEHRAHALGHKMEIQLGKHRFSKVPPPRIPKHPLRDVDRNMNEIVTYADLKLRWTKTFKASKKKMTIKRKWKTVPAWGPRLEPTCSFILHERMPYKDDAPMLPPPGFVKTEDKDVFAVMKSSHRLQHKVTVGDIIQTEKLHRREAGDKVTFGTVLLVGAKDYTIIGKPTVPYAKVHCTVEQQTLSKEMISFYYKPRRRMSRFMRLRHWVTMLRVDRIEVDPKLSEHAEVKPKRLIDMWANRWLSLKEVSQMKTPALELPEHQPGTYQRRGLVESYRFNPDPLAPSKGYL